jgi:hypothetical protein
MSSRQMHTEGRLTLGNNYITPAITHSVPNKELLNAYITGQQLYAQMKTP